MTLVLVLVLQAASSALPARLDTTPSLPQPAICNPKSEMALGDSLLKHGFNFEAGREFRRLLWGADTTGASAGLTHFKLGLSFASAGQLQLAAEELRAAGRLNPDLAEPAQAALAGYYARAQRYDLAAFELSDLLVFTRDSIRRTELNSALGWLRLQQGDISSAASSYDLAGKPDVAGTLRFDRGIRLRSPTWAAVLSSVIPGSGEAYAGRPATGLLAFAVTAGSLVWAVVAARSDDWVSASVVVSTLFWRYYNGSRANAITFAEQHNAAARRRRIARLASQVAEPDWFGPTDSLLGYEVRPDTSADGGTE
ncbi:tetratricopeptide repeat protein [candidate division WOR-3 bacterium]|nr:tetratricopeptide repeat protein [candidate division WOR-3 bacterium]